MSQTGKRQRNNGFLLLELIISIAILSMGLVVILNSFIGPIRLAELSQDYFRAGLLMEGKMLELYNSDIKGDSSRGIFSDFNSRFSWEVDVIKAEENPYKEASVKISWKEKGKEQDLIISTYLK